MTVADRFTGVRLAAQDAEHLARMIRDLTVRVDAMDEQLSAMCDCADPGEVRVRKTVRVSRDSELGKTLLKLLPDQETDNGPVPGASLRKLVDALDKEFRGISEKLGCSGGCVCGTDGSDNVTPPPAPTVRDVPEVDALRYATVHGCDVESLRMVNEVDGERALDVLHRRVYGRSFDTDYDAIPPAATLEEVDSAFAVLWGIVDCSPVPCYDLDVVAEACAYLNDPADDDSEGGFCGECE